MLRSFSFKNYKSYRDFQFFDLQRTRVNHNPASYTCPSVDAGVELLKNAVIYGANASGKSNFIDAISFFQNFVRSSDIERESSFSSLRQYKGSSKETNSEFEIDFYFENDRYEYGFEINSIRIESEWLYHYPKGKGKSRNLIERTWNGEKYEYSSPSLKIDKRTKEFIFNSVSEKELLLSKGNSLKVEQLVAPFSWIDDYLVVIIHRDNLNARDHFRKLVFKEFMTIEENNNHLNSFLEKLDLGFNKTEISDEKINTNDLKENQKKRIDEIVRSRREEKPDLTYDEILDTLRIVTPTFIAEGPDFKIEFSLGELSDGSRKVFDFSGLIYDIIKNNRTLIVDEFTDNLHALLTKRILEIFLSFKKSKSQLIFSTHDIVLMDMCFERDQIWVADKDLTFSSFLNPISRYRLRKENSFESNYLAGMLGGIPRYME